MATTTNYGWETPDDTDLVKDGALAQRTTASAIDTSLFSITNGKNVGLVKLNVTSFSNVATVSVDNIFSSAYDNYRIIIDLTAATATGYLSFRLRNAGINYTGATYTFANPGSTSAGATNNTANAAQTAAIVNSVYINAGAESKTTLDLFSPALATRKTGAGNFIGLTSAGVVIGGAVAINVANNSTYDGITFYNTAGNISGAIHIFGYRNSL